MHHASLLALVLSPIALAPAQVFRDTFTYPDGPVIPGWTQQTGVWRVVNGRVATNGAALWSYLTKDGLGTTRCVLDGEFFCVGTTVQFGGLTARYTGSGGNNLLMVKIQNNSGPDFDLTYGYEQPGGANSSFFPAPVPSAFCRMIVRDNDFWVETDLNRDGVYEHFLTPRPITLSLTGTGVGMNCYSTVEMDNFEFFDAVLVPQAAASPRIGNNYNLDLLTPSATVPWLGLVALGNNGFPIGARRIPVDPDFMAIGTFGNAGFGFVGATDTAGNGVMSIYIPPIPGLVGIRLFAAAVTMDGTQPFGVGNISNEQAFVIQP